MYQVPSVSIYKALIHRKQGKREGVDRKGGKKQLAKRVLMCARVTAGKSPITRCDIVCILIEFCNGFFLLKFREQ
jgi:hypothetical protein